MKTAFIIGAGFSKALSESYPVVKDFLKPLRASFKGKDYLTKEQFTFLKKALSKYSFFRNRSREDTNIEVVLNFFEYLNLGFGIRANSFEHEEISINAQTVLLYLKHYIRKRCGQLADASTDQYKIYINWIDSLLEDDSILSFNYDLVCEQLLTESWYQIPRDKRPKMSYDINIHPRLVYQYLLLGSQHKEIKHESIDFEYEREMERTNELFQFPMHLYLKLHGSINWWCCSRKDCPRHFRIQCDPLKYGNEHSKDNKFYRDLSDYSPSCQSCGTPMELVILAPNLIKPFDRFPRLQILWHKAADAMATAERVVVLGYSFSTTDLMTNFLFRINIQTQGPEKKWIIVDYDEKSAKKVKENLKQVLPYRNDVRQAEIYSNIVEWLSKN